MEQYFFLIALVFIAWQIVQIRREILKSNSSATLFLSIESNEEDPVGVPLEIVNLKKKINLTFPVVPGMEYADLGVERPAKVISVRFDSVGRGIYLKPIRPSVKQLKAYTDSYVNDGWEILQHL